VVRAVGTSGEISANSEERYRPAPTSSGGTGDTGGTGTGGGTGSTAPSFDFEGLRSGSVVPGWVDTGANYSLSLDETLFGVASTSLGGSFWTQSTASNIHSHMAAPAPST